MSCFQPDSFDTSDSESVLCLFVFTDLKSSGQNVHDLLRLGHLCGFFLSGELDLGCGGHGLRRTESGNAGGSRAERG